MALGRLALGTGWSGNLDFMNDAEFAAGAPRAGGAEARTNIRTGRGQSWAEPDLDHAWSLLRPMLADPARGRAIARRGQAEILRTHGNRAVGLRILERLESIAAMGMPVRRAAAPKPEPKPAPAPAAKAKGRRGSAKVR